MATRKPKIEYYWASEWQGGTLEAGTFRSEWVVNWRLVGANGETMCQSTQGFRDKTDAQRSVDAVAELLGGDLDWAMDGGKLREVGPGRKPK